MPIPSRRASSIPARASTAATAGPPRSTPSPSGAAAEIDPRTRESIYREVEETVAREALLIPLFHEQVYRFARPEVEGLTVGFGQPIVLYENLSIRG